MLTGIPLGRIAGIPVAAHWSVLLIVGLLTDILATSVLPATVPHQSTALYWLSATATTVMFLLSLLAHELARAIAARRQGIRVNRIVVWLLGGVSELDGDPPSPSADGMIAVVGPLTSLLLGGAFLLGSDLLPGATPTLPVAGLAWLATMNVLLGAFNLLPAAPLDGGRVLRAVLWRRTGDRARANRVAITCGQFLGWTLGAIGVFELLVLGNLAGLWFGLLGWFVLDAALTERLAGPTIAQLHRIGVADSHTPVAAPGWWTVTRFAEWVAANDLRYRAFPVVDFDGRPIGLVRLTDLLAVPEQRRPAMRVQDAARPLRRVLTVAVHASLADLRAPGVRRTDRDMVLVLDGDRLVGVVTAADVARAVELATLGVRLGGSNSGRR